MVERARRVARSRAPQTLVTVHDFTDEFLVVCPRCAGRALVQRSTPTRPPRLTCTCGLSRESRSAAKGMLFAANAARWPRGQYALGDAADAYFHLPLWLQWPCGKHTVWAYNRRHLQFLRDYVAATDRRRPIGTTADARNGLLASRLPRWMKLAANRAPVSAALDKLMQKMGDQS